MISFLSLGRLGRLANQLSQISGCIGIAIKNGHEYEFPYWKNYDHLERFASEEDIDIQSYFANPLPLLKDESNFVRTQIGWGYHDIKLPNGNFDLWGHMQSERYFKHCEDLIRFYFELKEPEHKLNIPEGSVMCHLRLGDYVSKPDYHPVMTKEYYDEAFKRLPEHGNIYLFSDEPEKAKKIIDREVTVVSGNHYMNDFYNMAQCDHFVIANSTFSWWAAYLSKNKSKTVIMPKNWFGNAAGITGEDLICENWIAI